MPNIKNIIDSHNKKIIQKEERTPDKPCNCRKKDECPLEGKCRSDNIVYQATVAANNKKETYIGLASTEFKSRYYNHTNSFNEIKKKNQTELSKHIWNLKEQNIGYSIKWKIIGRARPYSSHTKKCNLCLLEKYYIICHKEMSTLNKKSELVSHCRHRTKNLLISL